MTCHNFELALIAASNFYNTLKQSLILFISTEINVSLNLKPLRAKSFVPSKKSLFWVFVRATYFSSDPWPLIHICPVPEQAARELRDRRNFFLFRLTKGLVSSIHSAIIVFSLPGPSKEHGYSLTGTWLCSQTKTGFIFFLNFSNKKIRRKL